MSLLHTITGKKYSISFWQEFIAAKINQK